MKKKSLYFQVTFVFTLALIITGILVITVIPGQLNTTFEDIVFDKLENENRTIFTNEDILNNNQSENIAFIKYSSKNQSYFTSDNLKDLIDDHSAKLLVYKALSQKEPAARYVNTINNKSIYYVILNHHDAFNIQRYDISIVLTDDKILASMQNKNLNMVLSICLIAFIAGYLMILMWTFKLVDETKKIATSLKNIDSNSYRKTIFTKRKDEIGDLVDSIEIMRNKILENEKNKQEIIQGVSHDLKTPIAIIKSYAEAINDEVCDPKEASIIIDKECIRLEKNVLSLLDLTRSNYFETLSISFENIKMEPLIIDIAKSYIHRTKSKIALNLINVNFLGTLKGWKTVIENVLDNAIRYSNSKIEISLLNNCLTITNDGEHIQEHTLDNIFNLYEKNNINGTGIGLYTVKKIVESYGYTVTAKNSDNGVSFVITKTDE